MPHILNTFDFTPMEPVGLKKFSLMLRKLYEQLARIFNGGLSFGNGTTPDNISGVWSSVADTGAANTDFTIVHNLMRVPVGYIVMNQSKAGIIYQGSVAWTNRTITLRCSVADDNILIFIL